MKRLDLVNPGAWLLLSVFLLQGLLFSQEKAWTRMEPDAARIPPRENFVWKERAEPTEKHQCVFYLMGKNHAELEKILMEISDPKSPSYGKHLTKEQVNELTVDQEGTAAVLDYIKKIGATVTAQTASSIKAEAPISIWESALHTEFFVVLNTKKPGQRLLRAHEYSLPSSIAGYVGLVENTVQMPPEITHGPVRIDKVPKPVVK